MRAVDRLGRVPECVSKLTSVERDPTTTRVLVVPQHDRHAVTGDGRRVRAHDLLGAVSGRQHDLERVGVL
ncbi:hypothetical protein ACOZ4L_02745 [Haloplanus ruber]|uniref:Uncharacterized protein n=1 Tax=Haloplanus ruber TaxID=869892 RepID=A0ABD6CZJ3_9EURY|nr:hypothetical protein [Haloplanus ruber]